MEATLRQRWIDALRSGKYTQGTHRLRTEEDGYCCLGVLCDISGIGGWVRTSPENGPVTEIWHYQVPRRPDEGEYSTRYQSATILPDVLAEAVGIRDKQAQLVQLNDEEGTTFGGIADWIEKYVPASKTKAAVA